MVAAHDKQNRHEEAEPLLAESRTATTTLACPITQTLEIAYNLGVYRIFSAGFARL
jgi:hypothetical protein